jgi:septum formation protein
LLVRAGIPVEVNAAHIDERSIEAAELARRAPPGEIAARLAREKAQTISAAAAGRFVLGADQTLALEDRIFHKPETRDAAFQQISALAGKTQELFSAFAVVHDGAVVAEGLGMVRMSMRALTARDVNLYLDVAADEAVGSVGAYQVEHYGVHLFETLEGDYPTILGLPLSLVLAKFRDLKLLSF